MDSDIESNGDQAGLDDQLNDESSLPEDGDDGSLIDISPQKDGKLMKRLVNKGKGWDKPDNGDKVEVHYIGRLTDGTVFDSSRDRQEKFSFQVGAKQVIEGWDIAIRSMKRGERAVFTISHEFAYGDQGAPPKIPPNATLEFDIELFDWKLEDLTKNKDGGVTKRIIKDGEGYSQANEGATVEVHLIGKYKGKVFEDRDVTFFLGEGCEEGVVDGIEIAVRKMKKNELAEVHIKPEYAFGPNGKKEFGIGNDYQEVVYQVLLKNFEKVKENYEMDNEERLGQSEMAKTKGTKYYKENKFKLAIKQYNRIIDYLSSAEDFKGEEEKKQRDQLVLAGYLNLAMSHLKVNEFLQAIKQCDSALSIDGQNEKGLFRRGQAYVGIKEYELAKKDFQRVLELDGNNKAAKNQINACNNAIKAYNERERKTYRNMFERMAKKDQGHDHKRSEDVFVNANDNQVNNLENDLVDELNGVQLISSDPLLDIKDIKNPVPASASASTLPTSASSK